MTGLVRRAALLSVLGALAASAAIAGVPDPTKSTFGGPGNNYIQVSGTGTNATTCPGVNPCVTTGTVARDNSFLVKLVTVRDAGNNPINNSSVTINFSACAEPGNGGATPALDIDISTLQPHHPGALRNCAANTVTAVTNSSGVAVFRIAGSADNGTGPGGAAGVTTACAEVRADGVLLGNLRVAAYDHNNGSGVNGGDVSRVLGDAFAGLFRNRSDLNADLLTNGSDFSVELGVAFTGVVNASGGAVCP